MVLFAEVVLIKQSRSYCRNSNKKALAKSFLNLYLAQCSIPRISFQLGSLPGIVRVNTSSPGPGVASIGLKSEPC